MSSRALSLMMFKVLQPASMDQEETPLNKRGITSSWKKIKGASLIQRNTVRIWSHSVTFPYAVIVPVLYDYCFFKDKSLAASFEIEQNFKVPSLLDICFIFQFHVIPIIFKFLRICHQRLTLYHFCDASISFSYYMNTLKYLVNFKFENSFTLSHLFRFFFALL